MLKTRTELIDFKDTVQLTATFRDQNGSPVDADSFPQVTIIQPSGLVSVGPTSSGVMRLGTGHYQFDYTVSFSPGGLGVWIDKWSAVINGFSVEGSFNFVVNNTDQPQVNSDGYYHLGDLAPLDYTQVEIFNINKLLRTVKARLNSSGKSKRKDAYGNIIYINCDIFSTDTLVSLLGNSIALFNEIPHFTFFTFADTSFIDQFHDVIAEGAVLLAEAGEALLSRGLEYTISDNGISFTPPTMSELLNTQFSTLLTHHQEKVKFIKNSFKPHPIGLGGFSLTGSRNPTVRNLRLLRQRQIF